MPKMRDIYVRRDILAPQWDPRKKTDEFIFFSRGLFEGIPRREYFGL